MVPQVLDSGGIQFQQTLAGFQVHMHVSNIPPPPAPTRHHQCGAKSKLLILNEEVVRVLVEQLFHHATVIWPDESMASVPLPPTQPPLPPPTTTHVYTSTPSSHTKEKNTPPTPPPLTWHHECGAESQLLILVEEVVGVPVEHHATHRLQGEHILRPHLGHVKGVKREPNDSSSSSSSSSVLG
jgi:hypothetical protein